MPANLNHRLQCALTILGLLVFVPATQAAPRDATAVLLHCGDATLGDTTIYENHTVAGGRRILKYLSGTINFDRVGNDGWTFTYGAHGKRDHLSAAEMDRYMPCLTIALADSAAREPLKPVTTAERVETSMKKPYEKLIGSSLLLLLVITVVYFLFGRKPESDDE
jgi:hypothetical protein